MTVAARIAEALKGRKNGNGWLCRCPSHADDSPSLSVADGDDGRLLLHCFGPCEFRDVLAELRRRGLVESNAPVEPPSPVEIRRRTEERKAERQRNVDYARRIWRETMPGGCSPVEAYLRSRGYTGALPLTLRYHPSLKHRAINLQLPAMVGAVTIAPASIVTGIHRTFLRADGMGKAAVTDPKLSLGDIKGGAVRLASAGPKLVISEGIETGLSVMQATGLPTWAALSAGGIEALVLPPLPLAAEVIIAADNDASGRGRQAAEKAAARFHADGRKVRIAMPPEPGTDFNDLLVTANV